MEWEKVRKEKKENYLLPKLLPYSSFFYRPVPHPTCTLMFWSRLRDPSGMATAITTRYPNDTTYASPNGESITWEAGWEGRG